MVHVHLALLSDFDNFGNDNTIKENSIRKEATSYVVKKLLFTDGDIPIDETNRAVIVMIKTVYYPYWWLVDFATVVVHVLIITFLTFPMIAVWFYL